MPKVEQHDIREYYIWTEQIATDTAFNFFWPIPQAGYLDRIMYVQTVATTVADSDLTFFINNVATSPAGLTIPFTAAAIGRIDTVTFPRIAANYIREALDGDLIATQTALEIIGDGDSTAGDGRLCIVIKP